MSRSSGNQPGPAIAASDNSSSKNETCQICYKRGHNARNCWWRCDMRYTDDFQSSSSLPPSSGAPQAHVAQTSNASTGVTDWFLDSGATHHVTSDINNLSSFEPYEGPDQLHIGDGKGLTITHIGSATVCLGVHSIILTNVLLVPDFTKNLISLSQILADNNLTIDFHSCFCIIKDSLTSKILLQGRTCNGLYLLTTTAPVFPQALIGERVAADLWHSRLGHPSFTVTRKFITDYHLPCNKTEFHMCTDCSLAKSHKLPFSCSNSLSVAPLDLIHADVWGPAPVVTSNGFRYYVVFIDDCTKFVWIFFLHSKDEVLQVFTNFKLQVENLMSSTIKILRTDGGTEFKTIAKRFPQLVHQITCPYTPEQNGVTERKHRHIVELSLAAISHASLPLTLWDETFSSTVYLINRLPPANFSTPSPFEMLFNRAPDYLSLRVLGCQCFPFTRPYSQHKLQPRSTACVFLGYAMSQKGYRCLHIQSGRIFVSRHVIFNEQVYPFQSESAQSHTTPSAESNDVLWAPLLLQRRSLNASGPTDASGPSTSENDSLNSSGPSDASAQLILSPIIADNRPVSSASARPSQRSSNSNSTDRDSDQVQITTLCPSLSSSTSHPTFVPSTASTVANSSGSSHAMVTRSKDNTRRSKNFPDFVAYMATTPADSDPTTFLQATKVPHWQEAMSNEFSALLHNNTWVLVPPPANQNIVGCKWIFKTKRHADGTVERYKARLVAKGFTQEEGVDYFDTFSPVVRPTTIRIVLSIAVSNHWVIRQLDVSNAFLHGELHETVYMHQPPGFVNPATPSHVCLLKKALYGLKQSPRAWFQTLSAALLALGFHGSKFDPSLFIAHHNRQTVIVLIYVDDIIITGTSASGVATLINTLQKRFALKDLGPLHFFLAIAVLTNKAGVLLSQKQYILDLLCRTHMANAQPMSTPMAVNSSLSKYDGEPFHDPKLYRAVVGALQYITITRPDITFPVNKCSQFMHSPTSVHWSAVKRILRYLKGSADHGLLLKPSGSPLLHAYTDSDWAGCPDDRRSTSAFCIYLGPNLISWSSKKQPTVSKSSTEAEYRSLALAGAELAWVQYILKELHITLSQPPVLWCNNIGATYLASNPMFHARTKHVEIDFHFIRERVVNKQLLVKFISSRDQIADGLTKGLTVNRFLDIISKLMVCCDPST
ncbi:Gag/pol [Rhynchospora pubera]|uniref:Gag/pol n=1 Tax=Rhynchospora pubera TaxID=906938 RepID=A0AAV8E5L9_9POAL|nr:Gag/pol [Rhynchospora pubera]